ncbi:hypothetical protein EDB92DRAFT_1812722 [Lactarius akahatsu]|uniref:Uncharacterized protein n=1 Tax=Lactarius akahatsu TaxID=416441 RepID=A0AAD4LTV5_9AGAM|nr:hypothetical protein EDB92DRAFT_1812722 [Lactarius akahatsu]
MLAESLLLNAFWILSDFVRANRETCRLGWTGEKALELANIKVLMIIQHRVLQPGSSARADGRVVPMCRALGYGAWAFTCARQGTVNYHHLALGIGPSAVAGIVGGAIRVLELLGPAKGNSSSAISLLVSLRSCEVRRKTGMSCYPQNRQQDSVPEDGAYEDPGADDE